MLPIKAASLGYAHEQVVRQILEKGKVVQTQDGEFTLELLDVIIEVQTPLADPMVSPYCNFQGAKLREYVDGLLNGKKGDFTYDYHTRLFNWGKLEGTGNDWDACYDMRLDRNIDQIANIATYLKQEKNRDSRRAVAITWYPWKDLKYSGPCLQLVQFIIRDGKLCMTVIFRSNDMLSAAGANMYALVHLQKYMALLLQLEVGSYTHHSVSAHMYVVRDQKEVEDMAPVYYPNYLKSWGHNVIVNHLQCMRPDVPWKM
jgi:thymidylate synthase